MHDGSSDVRVAMSLEAQDHFANLVVRGRHPHRAGAVKVLEYLQGAKEDLGYALATTTTTACGKSRARRRRPDATRGYAG